MLMLNFTAIDNDWLAVKFQELLGAGLGIHPYARASGKDCCYIHFVR